MKHFDMLGPMWHYPEYRAIYDMFSSLLQECIAMDPHFLEKCPYPEDDPTVFEWCFGGDIYVAENEDDVARLEDVMRDNEGPTWVPSEGDETVGSREFIDCFTATSNAGGPSYFIPTSLAPDWLKEEADKNKRELLALIKSCEKEETK